MGEIAEFLTFFQLHWIVWVAKMLNIYETIYLHSHLLIPGIFTSPLSSVLRYYPCKNAYLCISVFLYGTWVVNLLKILLTRLMKSWYHPRREKCFEVIEFNLISVWQYVDNSCYRRGGWRGKWPIIECQYLIILFEVAQYGLDINLTWGRGLEPLKERGLKKKKLKNAIRASFCFSGSFSSLLIINLTTHWKLRYRGLGWGLKYR